MPVLFSSLSRTFLLIGVACATGCTASAVEEEEDVGRDEAAYTFTTADVAGNVGFGVPSSRFQLTPAKPARAWRLDGVAGDVIYTRASSSWDGTKLFLLNASFQPIAQAAPDKPIEMKLPATGTYYVAVEATAFPTFSSSSSVNVLVRVSGGAPVKSVAIERSRACAVLVDGKVKCWGDLSYGFPGFGQPNGPKVIGDDFGEMATVKPLLFPPGASVTSINTAYLNTCTLMNDASLRCWGDGQRGVNGQRWPAVSTDPVSGNTIDFGQASSVVSWDIGTNHACAVLGTGALKCWGDNGESLGVGNWAFTQDIVLPSAVPAVNLGPGRTAKKVAVGDLHTCALVDDGSIACWGTNVTFRGSWEPVPGQIAKWQAGQRYVPEVPMGTSSPVVDLRAGNYQTCALFASGMVKCWDNFQINKPNELGANLPAVKLGTGKTAKAIAVRGQTSCAILNDDSVKCWKGKGRDDGTMGDALAPIALGPGRKAVAISAGYESVCVVLDHGGLRCFGKNDKGQLGLDHDWTVPFDKAPDLVIVGH